jgi:hypothetical protein
MDWLIEFVKESLPTPWSRRVMLATTSIALVLLFLPEIAPKIGLPPIAPDTLLIRLVAVSTILFFGSLVTLTLVVRAYNEQNKKLMSLEAAQKEKYQYGVIPLSQRADSDLKSVWAGPEMESSKTPWR